MPGSSGITVRHQSLGLIGTQMCQAQMQSDAYMHCHPEVHQQGQVAISIDIALIFLANRISKSTFLFMIPYRVNLK